jgi:hypothetical protein
MKEAEGIIRPAWRQGYDERVLPNNMGSVIDVGMYCREECDISVFLATAGVLVPAFVEVSGMILRESQIKINDPVDGLFYRGPGEVEAYVNIIQLGDIMTHESVVKMELEMEQGIVKDDLFIEAFAAMAYVWNAVLAREYPDKEFLFEIGMFMFGETGLGMSFWQKAHARPDFGDRYSVEKSHPVWER